MYKLKKKLMKSWEIHDQTNRELRRPDLEKVGVTAIPLKADNYWVIYEMKIDFRTCFYLFN